MKSLDAVTLAAQMGGPVAADATRDAHHCLRALLRDHCKGPYSPDVDEFAPILRVDGRITHWDIEGCKYLRRSFKERYITIDVFVPQFRWKGKTEHEIREYLADGVRQALELCIARLKKDKTQIDGDALMRDYEKTVAVYLSEA